MGKPNGGSTPQQRSPTRIRLNLSPRRLLQAAGLAADHSFIYEFADKGTKLYGVFSTNRMRPKTAVCVVQRIISAQAGVQGGTSFVTVCVANGDVADMKAFAYQGSINKTVVVFWFGNHSPRIPPAASTCQLTFTVSHPHS